MIMKLKLSKKKMKSLSNDSKTIPANATPQIQGAGTENSTVCIISFNCGTQGDCKTNWLNTCMCNAE